MYKNRKIPILSDFTPQGLLLLCLIILGGIIVIGGIIAVIMILI